MKLTALISPYLSSFWLWLSNNRNSKDIGSKKVGGIGNRLVVDPLDTDDRKNVS